MKISLVATTFAILLFLNPAHAQADSMHREKFEGLIHFCSTEPPFRERERGDNLYLTGAVNVNYWETGNPRIDGLETNLANVVFNSSGGRSLLDVTLDPEAKIGGWSIRQVVDIPAEGGAPTAYGIGNGTGELRGMILRFRVLQEPPVFGMNNCPGDVQAPSVPIKGVILTPKDKWRLLR